MICGGRCENVRLQIGQYQMEYHMFSIDMGGCDIMLGVDWLRTLDPILMDFKELTMQFDQEGHQYKFQGITASSHEIISSHRMEKLLKKGHSGVITNSMPYKKLRHPLCRRTSNPSSLNIKLFFPLFKDSLLPVVFMIIPSPCTRNPSSQYMSISSPLFPKKLN